MKLSDDELKKQFFEVLQNKIQNDRNEYGKKHKLMYKLHHFENGLDVTKTFIGCSRAEVWYTLYLYKLKNQTETCDFVLSENGELKIIKEKLNKTVDDLYEFNKECFIEEDDDDETITIEDFVTDSVNSLFENDTEWLKLCYPWCYELNIYNPKKIIIQKKNVDEVYTNYKEKYNSNNHWKDNKIPDDYIDILDKNRTYKWIDKFKTYHKIEIDSSELYWLKEASRLSIQTGTFSHIYDDELEKLLEKHKNYDALFDSTGYFVRTDTVSLKYGQHKAGPYYDLKSIIESCVSCIEGHTPIKEDTNYLNFYLIPWIEIDDDKEFRVFVHKNKITAISQQSPLKMNKKLLNDERNATKYKWVNIIDDYFENEIKTKINYQDSYTIDIALIGKDDEPYMIEFNSFGAEYAAGSALFHWLIDYDILYDTKQENNIYFRYAV